MTRTLNGTFTPSSSAPTPQAMSTPLRIAGLLLTLLSSVGCQIQLGTPPVKGNGKQLMGTRDVEAFSQLDVGSAIQIQWKPSDETTLGYSVEENLEEFLVIESSNGVLKADFNRPVAPTHPVVLNVTSPSLEAINASGASRVFVEGLSADSFTVEASGASRCEVQGNCVSLTVDLSGASQLSPGNGSLSVQQLDLSASGASSAKGTASQSVNFTLSGASKVTLQDVQANVVEGDISSASTLQLNGAAERVSVDASGASKLEATNLSCSSLMVDASGASQIHVGKVSELLDAQLSGASQATYGGSPAKKSTDLSGGSKIRNR